jgi:hypothetical protein
MGGIVLEKSQSNTTRQIWCYVDTMLCDWRVLVVLGCGPLMVLTARYTVDLYDTGGK